MSRPPLMNDLSFLGTATKDAPPPTAMFHCGVIEGGPVETVTLAGQSLPLHMTAYAKIPSGNTTYGTIINFTAADHKKAIAKLGNLIVEWQGRPENEDLSPLVGVGPGKRYVRGRIKDKTAPGFECKVEDSEPLSKYVYIFPIVNRAEALTGPKPTVWEMDNGGAVTRVEANIAALQEQLEAAQRSRELVLRAEAERQEADSQNPAKRGPGRPPRVPNETKANA